MIIISCIKPNRVIELFDDQEIQGIHFKFVKKDGLQVTLTYDNNGESETEVTGIVKEFMKKDSVFRGLIIGVELVK